MNKCVSNFFLMNIGGKWTRRRTEYFIQNKIKHMVKQDYLSRNATITNIIKKGKEEEEKGKWKRSA